MAGRASCQGRLVDQGDTSVSRTSEKLGRAKREKKTERLLEHGKTVFYHKTFNSILPCLTLQLMTKGQHQHCASHD